MGEKIIFPLWNN